MVKKFENRNLISFRAEPDVLYYINESEMAQRGSLSRFINRSIRFYMTWINRPIKIMMLAKERYLATYKHVLRKNYNTHD